MTPTKAALPADPLAHEPTEIRLLEGQQMLEISWADGHISRLPFAYARGFCPCAVCQGHGGGLVYVPTSGPLQLQDVLEVGHYALNLVWGDGHRTGIYAMPYLRSMCLCSSCRALYAEQHLWQQLPQTEQQRFRAEADRL